MILNNCHVLHFFLLLEKEIIQCYENDRTFWRAYKEKERFDNGDIFAENSRLSYREYLEMIKINKVHQYEAYIELCDISREAKQQNEVINFDWKNINVSLINIKPSFLESWYDAVCHEIERLQKS